MSALRAIRYAYINAKVRAMQSKLLGKKKLMELLEQTSLVAIANMLEDTEYSRILGNDLIEFEKRLRENIISAAEKIRLSMPSVGINFFNNFIKRYEIESIKTFIRGIYFGLRKDEILEMIPRQHHRFFDDVDGIEDVVTMFNLSPEYEEFKRTKNLYVIEHSLDNIYYKNLFMSIPKDENDLREILGREVDIKNIKMAIRYVLDGIREGFKPLPNGYELSPWVFEEIVSGGTLDRMVTSLEGTSYYTYVVDAISKYNEKRSMIPFEIKLDDFLYEKAYEIIIKVPFGLAPIVAYMYLKEFEVSNLRTIVKLKQENFSVEEIKEHLRGIA